MMKLMEANNANAICLLAAYSSSGNMGVRQDMAKANKLFLRAGELGCRQAYHNLGVSYYYGRGVEVDKKKAKYYWELAAMNGELLARHNLGCMEEDAGNDLRAYKHFIIAANAGYKKSLDKVKGGYMEGHVTKNEYANTLRAYQSRKDEMKSDERDKARAHTNNGRWV